MKQPSISVTNRVIFFTLLSFLGVMQLQSQITVRVYPHIIRDGDGNGGITNQQLLESKNLLDSVYNPHRIYFEYECTNYIYDTEIFNNPIVNICADLENYKSDNGIDMFIGSDFYPEPGGEADGIPGSAFVIAGTYVDSCFINTNPNSPLTVVASRSGVLAHEMGHSLGLFHTFASAPDSVMTLCGYLQVNSCPELVNGSNCTICGDKVCDTSADANDDSTYYDPCTCQSISNFLDANQELIDPDGNNIMSYAPPRCRQYITPGQASRINVIMSGSDKLVLPNSKDPCIATLCCDYENKLICIMDDQCDSPFNEHCEGCDIQWINPPTGGNQTCITIAQDTSFVYEFITTQMIGGQLITLYYNGSINEYCDSEFYVSPTPYSQQPDESEMVTLFPNPTSNELTVQNKSVSLYEVRLLTLNGKLIHKDFIHPLEAGVINKNYLKHGTMLMQLKNLETGYTFIKKVFVLPN